MLEEINRSIKDLVDGNDGYCPCAVEKTPDTKCMCKEFRDQSFGVCHCGRFRKNVKAYLAGGIFCYGDLLRNTEWAAKIREAIPGIDLYSPVENTEINGAEGKKKFAGSQEIANGDNARLDQADILIACIDGDVLPSGTCAEIGRFSEKVARGDHKLLIGICTDTRQSYLTHSPEKDAGGASRLGEQQYSYQNLYVTGLLWQNGGLYYTIDEVIEKVKEWIK